MPIIISKHREPSGIPEPEKKPQKLGFKKTARIATKLSTLASNELEKSAKKIAQAGRIYHGDKVFSLKRRGTVLNIDLETPFHDIRSEKDINSLKMHLEVGEYRIWKKENGQVGIVVKGDKQSFSAALGNKLQYTKALQKAGKLLEDNKKLLGCDSFKFRITEAEDLSPRSQEKTEFELPESSEDYSIEDIESSEDES